jgi:hypothetical protein
VESRIELSAADGPEAEPTFLLMMPEAKQQASTKRV